MKNWLTVVGGSKTKIIQEYFSKQEEGNAGGTGVFIN